MHMHRIANEGIIPTESPKYGTAKNDAPNYCRYN